ncbi:MAG: DUF3108 domain-containing protein [Rickettsiales bacterium]|jgi:hypothetical protein|nr:DUF3108 domain-containing protein [Rickettsiales bacterium]
MKTAKKILTVFAIAAAAFGAYVLYWNLNSSEVEIEISAPAAPGPAAPAEKKPAAKVSANKTGPAPIAAESKIGLRYEARLMGVYAGRAHVDMAFDGGDYEIKTVARASGILKDIMKNRNEYETRGGISAAGFAPRYFLDRTLKSGGRTKDRVTEFSDGKWKYSKGADVDQRIFEDAIDPQTALIFIAKVLGDTGKCNATKNIFLGNSGITMSVSDRGGRKKKYVRIGKKKIAGTKCGVKLSNRAGERQKNFLLDHERKRSAAPSAPITAYYADIYGRWLPIIVEIENTGFGTVSLKLKKISVD